MVNPITSQEGCTKAVGIESLLSQITKDLADPTKGTTIIYPLNHGGFIVTVLEGGYLKKGITVYGDLSRPMHQKPLYRLLQHLTK